MTKIRSNTPEAKIVARLNNHFQSLDLITTKEFSVGYGRADLVVFKVNRSKCKKRFTNKQLRPLDRLEQYAVLRLLPEVGSGKSISLDYISDNLQYSTSYLRTKMISDLIQYGYIIEVEPRQYAKVNGFVPIADEIWAIEAKVSDWKKGAIQAKRYQVFANRVYLAVADEYAHRVNISLLEKHKIGLLSVGERVVEIFKAPYLQPRDPDRFNFATEWLWRYKRNKLHL